MDVPCSGSEMTSSRRPTALVVDDSAVFRRLITTTFDEYIRFYRVVTAPGGREALALLERERVDVVLLDAQMPGMDGLQTLAHIRRRFPGLPVVMISGMSTRATAMAVRATMLGAMDFVPKPRCSSLVESKRTIARALRPLLSSAHRRGLDRAASRPRPQPRPAAARSTRPFDLVVVGVSTGGPSALRQIIPELPAGFGVPVVVVQHMPEGFTHSLAAHLDRDSAMEVREAEDGDALCPGTALIAPGGRHVVLSGGRLRVRSGARVNGVRPAVDVLLASVAAARMHALVVILTGMGRDGMRGVQALAERRRYCLAQDAASCVVSSMPAAVVRAGVADEVVRLGGMAARLVELCSAGGPRLTARA